MFSRVAVGQFCTVVLLVGVVPAAPEANAGDDVKVFRVYDWSSFATPDRETPGNCRAIDKGKSEQGWAVARREIADVSDLALPDKQKKGTDYRVFVDYCVHVDGSTERPVGAMTFKAAKYDDLGNIKNWGSRHYRTTAHASRRSPKPGREHFNPPNFDRTLQ